MLFNSLQFLVFFTIVFIAYYSIPDRYRLALLFLASCYFYMAFVPIFILILFSLIVVDFYLGLHISRATDWKRKMFLVGSLIANVGTLFFFKYFNFFNENISMLAHAIHWNYPLIVLQVVLPLGLSFHVFQSLSYVIEVYRGKQEPEHTLGIYALYVMFFPQLVAGPIERPQHMLPQFRALHPFDRMQVRRGFELMAWGFFKKLVIADKIAPLVNTVYANLDGTNGFGVFLAMIAFSYQLYCDFSGYSDIAVGAALVFGYDLTNNFNRPFSARSIGDFWRRWHISLSSWLRDYLYYPLAFTGKNVTRARITMSLFITFVLIGLWHGANWTYVIFGTIHGIYTIFALGTAPARKRISKLIGMVQHQSLERAWQTLVTFILVTISFVFFRAANVGQALHVFRRVGHAFSDAPGFFANWRLMFTPEVLGIRLQSAIVILFAILLLEYVQYLKTRRHTQFIFENTNRFFRWCWQYFIILSILGFGYLGAQTFIYFQF